MGRVARAIIIILMGCLMSVGIAQMIGSGSVTTIATAYLGDKDTAYVLYVRDTIRDFRLWLAGTRCFRPLPRWASADHDEIINMALDRGQAFSRVDDQIADTFTRLRCR